MNTLKRHLLIAAGLLLCSVAMSSTTVVRAVAEKVTSVFVTNDSAHAVPVSVTNLPAVQDVSRRGQAPPRARSFDVAEVRGYLADDN